MSQDKLVKCHFTVGELEYLNKVIIREQIMHGHLKDQLSPLKVLGVTFEKLESPNIIGRILSYIKKGKEET